MLSCKKSSEVLSLLKVNLMHIFCYKRKSNYRFLLTQWLHLISKQLSLSKNFFEIWDFLLVLSILQGKIVFEIPPTNHLIQTQTNKIRLKHLWEEIKLTRTVICIGMFSDKIKYFSASGAVNFGRQCPFFFRYLYEKGYLVNFINFREYFSF